MMYDVLTEGTMKTMAADDNGVTCTALNEAIREINTAIVSINTKQKALAFTLATVKREGLWQKGKGWKSFEAFCKSWNISKTDASRYSRVGEWLTKREEDGRLVTKWSTKTQDFSFSALAELISVDEAQVTAWLEGDILTLKASCRDCRKAKAMLKGLTDKDEDEAAKEDEAKEPEAKEPATISGEAYMNYAEALAALKALAGDNADLIAAIGLVDEAVQAMFKAGTPAIEAKTAA